MAVSAILFPDVIIAPLATSSLALLIASFTALSEKSCGSGWFRLSSHLEMILIVWSVSMLVYIKFTSAANILAFGGSVPSLSSRLRMGTVGDVCWDMVFELLEPIIKPATEVVQKITGASGYWSHFPLSFMSLETHSKAS